MRHLAVILFLSLAGLQLQCRAQEVADCTDISADLRTDPITPSTVPDLPVCEDERDSDQCCLSSYIFNRLNITEEDFLAGLREELEERFEDFDELVEHLEQYLQNDFVPRYLGSLGDFSFLSNASSLTSEFISDLVDNIEFDPEDDEDEDDEDEDDEDEDDEDEDDEEEDTDANGFNVADFLQQMINRLEESAIEQFAGDSAEKAECIRMLIEDNIEQQRMMEQVEAIQQIRRVVASIEHLSAFVHNFTNNLGGFRPLRECLNTLVRRNTCGRCVARRPPFCRNVCRAIASACYSPFNEALKDQLDILWEVVRRILDAATDAVGDLNENRGILRVDRFTLIQQGLSQCEVNFDTGSLGRRQVDDDSEDDDDDEESDSRIPLLPDVIRTAARALNGGPFAYAGRSLRGPGLCRRIATARVNCWDDDEVRSIDIPEFDGDDIKDQVNNPVIDLDEDELQNQADSLGTPISDALNDPSFAQVAPSQLVIPGNGGVKMALSLSLSALMLFVGIVVVL